MAQILLYVIIGFILFEFVLSKVLSWLNLKTWDKPMPEEVKDLYDQKKYTEARDYAWANFKTGALSSVLSLVLTVAFLWFKGFAWIDNIARGITDSPILQALIFFGIIGAASYILSLPFDIYDTFVTEQNFGFNKTTPKLFVMDKSKALALAIILGGGILALLAF